jgi:hypothetical protein
MRRCDITRTDQLYTLMVMMKSGGKKDNETIIIRKDILSCESFVRFSTSSTISSMMDQHLSPTTKRNDRDVTDIGHTILKKIKQQQTILSPSLLLLLLLLLLLVVVVLPRQVPPKSSSLTIIFYHSSFTFLCCRCRSSRS